MLTDSARNDSTRSNAMRCDVPIEDGQIAIQCNLGLEDGWYDAEATGMDAKTGARKEEEEETEDRNNQRQKVSGRGERTGHLQDEDERSIEEMRMGIGKRGFCY